VKKIQEEPPVQEEEEPNAELSRWKFSGNTSVVKYYFLYNVILLKFHSLYKMLDSKEHDLLLEADRPYTHLKSKRSVNEIKPDYGLLRHSPKVGQVGHQEIKLQGGIFHFQSETVKDHSLPKMTESQLQLELLPTKSNTIITEQTQNIKAHKDTIMVILFI
jgi:hypothetical protein